MLWDFLFGSIFGWWILILIGASLFAGLRAAYRRWLRHRREMAANLVRIGDPRNAESRFTLAQIYSESRKWKRSIGLIDEAIEIARADTRYNHVPHRFLKLKGDCLYGKGDWVAAAAAYHEALKVQSDAGYADALLGVARSELRAGRWKEAAEFSRHAIHEHESRLEAYFRWAQAAAAAGDSAGVEKARSEFRRVAGLLPPFARQRRMWWRFAFLTFPVSRRIG